MRRFSIRNFSKFQHYKERKPPWVKLYRELWRDRQFFRLRPDSKLLLLGLFTIASQTDNVIEDDPAWIANELCLPEELIDFNPLISAGFLECEQDASDTLAGCEQPAPPSVSVSVSGSVSGSVSDLEQDPAKETESPAIVGDHSQLPLPNRISVTIAKDNSARTRATRRKPETEWPETLTLTDAMRAYATERGIEPEREFSAWHDDCLAHGRRYRDWTAAWRTRINNAPVFAGRARAAPVTVTHANFSRPYLTGQRKFLAERLAMIGGTNDAGRDNEAFGFSQRQLVSPADRRRSDRGLDEDPGARLVR